MSKKLGFDEDHGSYIAFHYGQVYSFMATRSAGESRWHLSRSTVGAAGNLVLTLVGLYDSILEVREAAKGELTKLLGA